MYTLFIFSLIGLTYASYINQDRPDEGADWSDIGLTPTELIHKYKYPVEQHQVQTDDGYYLSVQRIPYGRVCPKDKIKGSVLLSSGVLLNAITWILAGTKNGLGYILADSCYDVWLMNHRGSIVSSGQSDSSSISDLRYWDFSFHEMGQYDQPAVVDYILTKTGLNNITYIGFYEGATIFFVFLSLHPEYNDKVKAAFLLAPPPMAVNPSMAVAPGNVARNPISVISDIFRVYTAKRKSGFQSLVSSFVCTSLRVVNPFICETLAVYPMPGYDHPEANLTLLSLSVKHHIFGTTIKDLMHGGQIISSGIFRQYDYGRTRNHQMYGQTTPPEYNITAIATPLHLYTTMKDEPIIREGSDEFQNVQEIYVVPYSKFNYLDHIIASNITGFEYDHLLKMIDSYYK